MKETLLQGGTPLQGPVQGPVISLEDVRKSFGGFELGPLDLKIEPGQLVAIVGPSIQTSQTQMATCSFHP